MKTASFLTCLLLAAACSAPEAGGRPEITGLPQRVAYLDYRNGLVFELVNESHTDRVEQYSALRQDASRKVQSDEVVSGLIEALRAQGFRRMARSGAAPRGASAPAMMAVEIDDGGGVEHVLGLKGMPADDRRTVLALGQSVLEIYNATYSLQAVEVREGESPFENPVGPTQHKPPVKIDGPR